MNTEFHIIQILFYKTSSIAKLLKIHVPLPSSESNFKHNITAFLFVWVKKEALWE